MFESFEKLLMYKASRQNTANYANAYKIRGSVRFNIRHSCGVRDYQAHFFENDKSLINGVASK